MKKLAAFSVILWLLSTYLISAFFASTFSLITTVLFCGKLVEYSPQTKTILTTEIVGFLMTLGLSFVFKDFHLVRYLLYILVRCIFLGIVWYDDNIMVRITKVVRVEEEGK